MQQYLGSNGTNFFYVHLDYLTARGDWDFIRVSPTASNALV